MLFSSIGKNTNFILLMYLGLMLVHILVSPRLTKPRSICTYFIYCTSIHTYTYPGTVLGLVLIHILIFLDQDGLVASVHYFLRKTVVHTLLLYEYMHICTPGTVLIHILILDYRTYTDGHTWKFKFFFNKPSGKTLLIEHHSIKA